MRKFFSHISVAFLFAVAAFSGPAQALSMSNYLENKLVDYLFRAQTFAPPLTMHVGLFTSACNDAGPGTEVSGAAYGRGSTTNALANWAGTQAAASTLASSGTGGTTSNNVVITFPTPTATWGAVTHMGIFDAATAGNMMFCFALTTAKTINTGDTITYPAGSLTLQIDN